MITVTLQEPSNKTDRRRRLRLTNNFPSSDFGIDAEHVEPEYLQLDGNNYLDCFQIETVYKYLIEKIDVANQGQMSDQLASKIAQLLVRFGKIPSINASWIIQELLRVVSLRSKLCLQLLIVNVV